MMTSAARAAVGLGIHPADVWVSLERNMHCGIAHCGRCQLGPLLLCRDGAVVRWDSVEAVLEVRGRRSDRPSPSGSSRRATAAS
jgi:hypothetical protein